MGAAAPVKSAAGGEKRSARVLPAGGRPSHDELHYFTTIAALCGDCSAAKESNTDGGDFTAEQKENRSKGVIPRGLLVVESFVR